jgi:mono/diheme cytochrome c family protein
MKKNRKFIFILNLILLTTLISFCTQYTNARIPANQNRELEEVISVGIKVYEANCIKCHKADLKGAENWKTDRDDDGHRLAPPLNAVIEYMYSVWPEDCGQRQNRTADPLFFR